MTHRDLAAFGVVVLPFTALAAVLLVAWGQLDHSEVQLTLIALFGVIFLLFSLAAVAVVFSLRGLADQALGCGRPAPATRRPQPLRPG